jgi:hypothetical protein
LWGGAPRAEHSPNIKKNLNIR